MATQNVKDFNAVNSVNLLNDSFLSVQGGELVRLNGLNTAISGINQLSTNNINITGSFISSNRLFINGTGVLLSGEAGQVPNTVVQTSGSQNISGSKTFSATQSFTENVTFSKNISVSQTGIFGNMEVSVDEINISGINLTLIDGTGVFQNILLSGNPVLTGVDLSSYATISNLATTGST